MSEKTLKFNNIVVDKKEFRKSKQPINFEFSICRSNNNIQQI